MAANPMTQFEVYRIGPEIKIGAFDISFTNSSLFMVVSSLAILIISKILNTLGQLFFHWNTKKELKNIFLNPVMVLHVKDYICF